MIVWRIFKKIIKYICLFLLAILLTCAVFALYGFYSCSNVTPQESQLSQQIKETNVEGYARPMSSSYLTFPEWYIVYSSREYANYLKNNLPSGFPYFSSVAQYWCSYGTVYRLSKNQPFNFDDNLMLAVIGVSFSAEYIVKGVYENTIGRLTEMFSNHQMVEEDKYAQQVAQEYVEFIPYKPWFEFSFANSLSGLWHQTGLTGHNNIRKWERKIILTLEYSVKTVYAWLIGSGSHAALGAASDYVYATVKAPSMQAASCPGSKIVKQIATSEYIVGMPHEQLFTECVDKLTHSKAAFVDIAGNQSVLMSFIAPVNWQEKIDDTKILFTQTILTEPTQQRMVLLVPVNQLLNVINQLKRSHIAVEHIYDY